MLNKNVTNNIPLNAYSLRRTNSDNERPVVETQVQLLLPKNTRRLFLLRILTIDCSAPMIVVCALHCSCLIGGALQAYEFFVIVVAVEREHAVLAVGLH